MAPVLRHRTLNVYVSPDAYVFEPVDQADGPGKTAEAGAGLAKDVLVLDRLTGSISLNPPNRAIPLAHEAVHTVFGILGIVPLAQTDHLVLIKTLAPRSPRFLGHDVHSPSSFLILPLAPSSARTPSALEDRLLALVQLALDSTPLWFSYSYDLTSSLQRQHAAGDVDERFFWNFAMTRRLVDAGVSGRKDSVVPGGAASGGSLASFVLPVICGSFDLRSVSLPSTPPFLLLLISRRSRHRPGTRYNRRGIDADGHAANYVETEQIVVADARRPTDVSEKAAELGLASAPSSGGEGKVKCSFVQIRGSAPVFWGQINNLRYVPDLLVMDLPSTTDALRAHLTAQIKRYERVHLVNLVNQVKYERPVKEAFENALLVLSEDESKVKYQYWDFHRECKGMRFDRVDELVGRLREDVEQEGWFQWEGPLAEVAEGRRDARKTQRSVVRTNCMDSLDRTNVVQSALARAVLDLQLRALGLLGANDSVAHHPEFLRPFRHAWADHADAVSTMYSGTGALKTDFTRTGKRSWQGALEDGRRSVIRYWKNNFKDGERQDALDLITGAWKIRRGTPSPFTDDRALALQIMPYVFVFAALLFASGLVASYEDLLSAGPGAYLHLPVLALIAALSFWYIWANGVQYVDYPRLTPNALLSYTGPGHRTTPRGRGVALLPRSLMALLSGSLIRRLPWTSRTRTQETSAPSAGEVLVEGVSHVVEGVGESAAGARRKGRGGRLD